MLVFTDELYLGEVRGALTDEDRKPKYRGDTNLIRGQCYVACEVLKHGKFPGTVVPMTVRINGEVHWFLKSTICPFDFVVYDPTADQFDETVPYQEGRARGFLTKKPSKRAQKVLERLGWNDLCCTSGDSTTKQG